ncbi:disease resistance protein RPM1-like isoform X1 [Magnolia sinica]|uniref:disease resistance protein RPM1-like isoform X1 n=1 Tax=Magnolia sinica TaxID=86752 RepID=UPI002659EEA3|nr:disease resistance protein RPM1-like isoform X1 [Magnolia sinica]
MGTEVVLRFLIDKLKSLLGGEERAWLTTELQDEFSKIISESECLIPFLQAADASAETEARRIWMKRVREVVFEVEDILDDLALHFWQHESVGVLHKAFSTIPDKIIRHRITVQIREIHTKFQKLSEDAHVYLMAGGILSSASEDHSIFPPHLEEDDIVGTKTAIDELLKWLVEGEERLTVVSVVGMGGLGKTTLVRQVFNSPYIKNRFDCHAWVTVSQSFRKDKLLQSMIKQFDEQVHHEVHGWTEVELAEHLHRYLQSKRYVIVLDDVWSIDLWEGIKHMLPDTRCGSRVIVTTRNYEVAMSTYGHVYNLQLLTSEEAWSLFRKKAFPPDAECPQELEKPSRYVVTRCGGLPLAIAVTGGFFSTKRDLSEWEPFIHNLGSKLESNPYFTTLIRVIKLSYNALPYYLKFCFLYMGIFPEDVPIRITRLIRLWIAEGFVQAMEGKTREEVALGYLNELVRRSLVRVSEFHDDGRLGSCQIHDLIREMILSVVREESFFIRYGEEDMNLYGRVRRLYINDNFAGVLMLERSQHLLHLRSLLVFGKESIFGSVLAEMGVHKFTFLKVLDLEGTPVKSLPSEIGNLLHLRYLSLRNTMITGLPKSMGKLVNIETLDLKGTCIAALPIEILKLKFLRHLIVSHYDMNGVSVPKGIGKLSALQTLTCIDIASEVAAISELGNLIQMMRLCIANLRREDGRTLCSSIEKMNRLISFKAMSKDGNQSLDLPAISPTPPHLQRIHLNGRLENLPDWIASLHKLVKMSLFGSRLSDDPLKILQSLPNLVVLTLEAAYDGEELCCQAEGLPKLKVLKLARLYGLKSMRVEKGAMPCLQKLHLDECKMLEKVPFGIEHLTHLKELYLMKMPDALIKSITSDGEEDHRKIEHIPLVRTKSISTLAGE